MLLENTIVLSNLKVSENFYLLSLISTESISHCKPGQFYMLKCKNDIFTLRRPISLHYANKETNILEFYYEIKGGGTRDLSSFQKGNLINIQGPLGNGFDTDITGKNLLVIGGGMGLAPMKFLIDNLSQNNNVTFIIGARNTNGLSIINNFDLKNIQTFVTTDDGSRGIKGNVVDKLKILLENNTYDMIFTCGPEPMMLAIGKIALEHNIPCQISLEARMACGVKACVGCSIKTNNGMKKVCHDGPVFQATAIVDVSPHVENTGCTCGTKDGDK
ncbi:dihydroorotate dehydrogenase electron transfer subunit [Fusobacterium sp. PH5-44]|uniref:dihydroorotate dehydrogenase electron transfer subunit n=1 Tax=unclassified Fusobacterium TaxID=2648384 RepID=UPI003D1DAE7E